MSETNVKKKVLRGAFWLFLEKTGMTIMEFAVSWVLARFFLDPSDYATAGLITIFIGFSNIFIKSGFNHALIQKKEITQKDKSTVFWLSLGIAVFFYILLFILAPVIANFYGKPILVQITRIEALVLILDALSIVHTSILEKALSFKRIFAKTILTTVFSTTIALVLAISGFGVWALVFQTVATSFFGTVFLWIFSKWVPSFEFSIRSLKSTAGFSTRLLASSLINNVYQNALPAAMEKLYDEGSLGYYNKAKTIPTKISESVNATVTSIVFPSLAEYQNDKKQVKEMTRRFIVTGCFLTFALMAGLIAVAEPMILFIYGEKWAKSIMFTQFACIACALQPVDSANLQAIKAFGRTDIYLKLELIKNGLGILILGTTMFLTHDLAMGIYYALIAKTIASIITVFINAFPNKKLMDYSIAEQAKDVMPSLLLATFMCICVWSVTLFKLPNIVTILIQVPLGILIYVGLAKLFKLECFNYLVATLKEKRRAKKNGN